MSKQLINLTAANDNADKTVMANAGVAAGQKLGMFLSSGAVRLINLGYADDIVVEGFKPLMELLASFTDNGGKLWVCPPFFNACGLDQNNLIADATFAFGESVAEMLGQGAARFELLP